MNAGEIAEHEMCCGIDDLSATEEAQLIECLASAIPSKAPKIGRTTLDTYKIDLQAHLSVKQKNFRVSPVALKAMYDEVYNLLAENFIEHWNSDWSNLVVMVKKSNGSYRVCVDYRKVNKLSKGDA
ncbi:uncharacterized protein LOC117178561 [Belonocnema kinseyi]|uniref:uncharacterized protein LOC117178561 n=1 Tax=Belonocnema kinseyi TaxID=2817044 RepID=UPI00143DA492|nr:uncharacterized protein LOC117178561 [Belonocnema kinseyi]